MDDTEVGDKVQVQEKSVYILKCNTYRSRLLMIVKTYKMKTLKELEKDIRK